MKKEDPEPVYSKAYSVNSFFGDAGRAGGGTIIRAAIAMAG
jgi:hypothetical protein